MHDGYLNSDTQKAGRKSRLDIVQESMGVAGDAIIDFVKNPFSQPKYLTAFGGLLALVGTVFPWTFRGGVNVRAPTGTHDYIGFSTVAGIPFALFGLVIIIVAIIFGQSKLPSFILSGISFSSYGYSLARDLGASMRWLQIAGATA